MTNETHDDVPRPTTPLPADRTVLVILGSTRARRLCPTIADWVVDIAEACTSLRYEIVDLADWPLPANDEPGIPALGSYAMEHTRAWSRKVGSAGGFVFVTPQYNWGYPAPLKNAIDHLYKEWHDKPLVIVSYGGHGGGKCAAQLKQVASGLKMRPIATMPGIELTDEILVSGACDPSMDFLRHIDAIRLAFSELEIEMRPDQL